MYCSRETEDSFDAGHPQESENTEDNEELLNSSKSLTEGEVAPSERNAPRSRVHKKVDDVELKILKAIETPCSKMAFLNSLMPHLDKFDTREFLQFQMGVLNVIENINTRKQGAFCATPTFANHPLGTSSYQQYENPMNTQQFPHSPAMHQQQFPQLPVLYHQNQQYRNPIPQTVTYQTNPNQYQNPNNQSISLIQSGDQQKTATPQHPVRKSQDEPTKSISTAQYFHNFDHDSSSVQDSDVAYSPSTSGSLSNSDQIQF